MTTPRSSEARRLDAADPGHRHLFHVPPADGGRYPEAAYLAGNSLGLQPRATRDELLADLDAWARLGVEGHLEAERPWLPYHELLTAPGRATGRRAARGDRGDELADGQPAPADGVASTGRPAQRTRIVIEDSAFPSDSYAVRSQARFHGLDPDDHRGPAAPAPRRGHPAHRGRARLPGAPRATRSRWCCSAGSTTSPAS